MSRKKMIGFFDEEEKLLEAIRKTRENSLIIDDIYMP